MPERLAQSPKIITEVVIVSKGQYEPPIIAALLPVKTEELFNDGNFTVTKLLLSSFTVDDDNALLHAMVAREISDYTTIDVSGYGS